MARRPARQATLFIEPAKCDWRAPLGQSKIRHRALPAGHDGNTQEAHENRRLAEKRGAVYRVSRDAEEPSARGCLEGMEKERPRHHGRDPANTLHQVRAAWR